MPKFLKLPVSFPTLRFPQRSEDKSYGTSSGFMAENEGLFLQGSGRADGGRRLFL